MLHGKPLNPGQAIGKVYWHITPHPSETTHSVEASPDAHWEKLQCALTAAEVAWRALSETLSTHDTTVSRDILEAQIAMAKDTEVLKQTKAAIYHKGKSGDVAYKEAMLTFVSLFEQLDEGPFKQRAQDIKDVLARVLSHYHERNHKTPVFHEDTVLMAEDLHPGVLLELMQPRCVAVVLEKGSLNSHTAIVAKQLTIPVIIQVPDLHQAFADGDSVIVDGDCGRVYSSQTDSNPCPQNAPSSNLYKPNPDTLKLPCALAVNVMGLGDLNAFKSSGAQAIGLFRTEFLPDVTRGGQVAVYQRFFALEVPMIVRLFDYGADKIPPNQSTSDSTSQLGMRGLRWLRHQPSVLNTQLHALYDAAKDKALQVEFPMVTTPEEYHWGIKTAKALLDARKQAGLPTPKSVQFGPLIEVPAAALALSSYISTCDFIAIGSNDLHQYFFAADRHDAEVTALYAIHDPAFLQLIEQVIHLANENKVPVTVCGQMAAEPLSAWLLSGMGDVTLSVPIPDYKPLAIHLDRLNRSSEAKQLRHQVLSSSASAERTSWLAQLKKVVNDHASMHN